MDSWLPAMFAAAMLASPAAAEDVGPIDGDTVKVDGTICAC
jgi:hypothetical protein